MIVGMERNAQGRLIVWVRDGETYRQKSSEANRKQREALHRKAGLKGDELAKRLREDFDGQDTVDECGPDLRKAAAVFEDAMGGMEVGILKLDTDPPVTDPPTPPDKKRVKAAEALAALV